MRSDERAMNHRLRDGDILSELKHNPQSSRVSATDRRRFLKLVAACPLAALASLSSRLIRPASAEPVTIALAVISTGLTVAKMLAASGPSTADLLNLQTALLMNISK